jgi:magnesium-transporting ATPase (P-type)
VFAYPQTFVRGILQRLFTWKRFGFVVLMSVVHVFILNLFILIPFTYHHIMNEGGKTEDITIIGTVLFCSLVLTVLLQTFVVAETFNAIFIGSHAICIGMLIIYIFFVSFVPIQNSLLLGLFGNIGMSANSMFSILLPPLFCFVLSYYVKVVYSFFHRTYIEEIRDGKSVKIVSQELFRQNMYKSNLN